MLLTKENRKKLGKWVLFSLLMVAAYLPWLPYFYAQVTKMCIRDSSDDFVEPDMYASLAEQALKGGWQIVQVSKMCIRDSFKSGR